MNMANGYMDRNSLALIILTHHFANIIAKAPEKMLANRYVSHGGNVGERHHRVAKSVKISTNPYANPKN